MENLARAVHVERLVRVIDEGDPNLERLDRVQQLPNHVVVGLVAREQHVENWVRAAALFEFVRLFHQITEALEFILRGCQLALELFDSSGHPWSASLAN